MVSDCASGLDPRQAAVTGAGRRAARPASVSADTLRYPPSDTGLAVRTPQDILQANADLIERLRLHAAMQPGHFQARFLDPLLRLAEQINVLPASANSLFSGEMGLFRACLEAAFFAFQASDGRIFTGAETVERRIALESRWRYLCFLAAMFHPLGRTLERIAVAGPRGQVWKRHFSGVTPWAQEQGVERLFVSWGAADAQGCIGPSNAALVIVPAVVGSDNLQMLDDGAAQLVAALYQLVTGEAGSSRIAYQVVSSCWERIARREAARRPQAFGRLTSGTHQGPYLAGALRALVDTGVWQLNASALKADRDGLYLEWPHAAGDLIAFGQSRGYAGWPHDAPTLAALLRDADLVEDGGGELGLLQIVSDEGEIRHALKIANPLAVLEDFVPEAFAGHAPRTLAGVIARDPLSKAEAAAAQAAAAKQPAASASPAPAPAQTERESHGAASGGAAGHRGGRGSEAHEPGQAAAAGTERDSARMEHPAPAGPGARRDATGAGAALEGPRSPVGSLREAPEVRYSDLVPEDIRKQLGSALQAELLGKIVKTWRERGEHSTVMRRIDTGAAIDFGFLTTQVLNVPTWVDCMARAGLVYAPPNTPGLRIQKVSIPEGRPPVQAVVLSNLACRRLGL
ncbi:TraI domain-containing protein [Ramlibacter sp. AN1133]|uniref:TraI domain-containing protein n=1 Tax=Ramlibacter sp. AN1133 TaxID=3133429 RepID=UPI0030C2965F